eukprot:CAMPEP_0197176190 /NCGR_PEP_ID=MMETSP1423-20130617/2201_1 /TAXON_ID=476441 /ORGANISM="Pseudo-nitzschia heimii, Strain UNC1101" /LENGTH=362 /DNA_ID=CAMNT_0042625523 /DNA_START=127 /DNA_END=1215 /DNA_ORIENTATION=-
MTPDQVANDIFDAIAGTLYKKQKLDPSIASNARSNSLYSHRPTRSTSDEGRVGIELDGAEFLFRSRISPDRAQRIFSLILAAKLSHDVSWNEYEDEDHTINSFRPVALTFNTIKEALLARREMQILQNDFHTEIERSAFDYVIIQTLSDGLPQDLFIPKSVKRKHGRLRNLAVDPKKGLMLVVQPTDFNQDFNPARPSLNSLNDLQKMATCALIQQTPVVVISPRFLSYGQSEAPDNEIYQSGFQQASFYGGKEPPRGPTPFILRDFSPPSYCWVGDALSVSSNERHRDKRAPRMILTNSVMDEDHPWNVYVSGNDQKHSSENTDRKHSKNTEFQAVYLASTRSASGRPTKATMNKILLGSM